ncbi:dipeptide epimerase [Anaerocolumna sp. AGMB13025]|uniref:dipeptide epimerase n=1 Tax=Anaerocolumna sp. AGMB13025 TaxID=3039116 RepID=UPI00241DEE54|nr:dipeptide epimerase [Anaerocolumna sp. AGMB13025]WFR55967.1 dipeptide epimerase [Anaerocolumna sp. AGMB13025]
MIIKNIEVGEIFIPLARPFKTALRTVNNVEDIIIKVETETGLTGFGEAPPTAVITGDTKGSIITAVKDFITPALMGMELDNLDGIFRKLNSCMVKNTSAKAAVDMAIYDLYAKQHNTPLYKMLGGNTNQVETDLTISVNSIPEMVADSLDAVKGGYRILKIKVGKEGIKDLERITEIRKAIGPDIKIRVDANQGWTAKQSVQIIRAMEDKGLDIELVEQPVPAHDFKGMQFVTSQVATPILADESVFSAEDAITLIQNGAADLINIKLMKTGGIYNALKICDIAEIYGVECMIGCMLEGKLSVSAAAHLAAAKGIITRADLDGPSLCKTDPFTGGPVYAENMIYMNETPGIGIEKTPCFL